MAFRVYRAHTPEGRERRRRAPHNPHPAERTQPPPQENATVTAFQVCPARILEDRDLPHRARHNPHLAGQTLRPPRKIATVTEFEVCPARIRMDRKGHHHAARARRKTRIPVMVFRDCRAYTPAARARHPPPGLERHLMAVCISSSAMTRLDCKHRKHRKHRQ